MSEPRNGVKTLGIKLPDTLHAQFALTAHLDDLSLGDAALQAVELYVETKRQAPDFAARAEAASLRLSGKPRPGGPLFRGCLVPPPSPKQTRTWRSSRRPHAAGRPGLKGSPFRFLIP